MNRGQVQPSSFCVRHPSLLSHCLSIVFLLTRNMPCDIIKDTVRSYKQFHKLGRFAPPSPAASPAPPSIPLPATFKLGARCQVALSDQLFRRGAIRFIGPTHFGPTSTVPSSSAIERLGSDDLWIGVEFDEPVGKGDGL